MLVEIILLSVAVVGLTSIVGAAPVALLVPDLGGTELLLTPFAGLALLYWVCQWLSPFADSSWIVFGTCVISVPLAGLVVWRQRGKLKTRLSVVRADLSVILIGGLLITILLQLPMIHRGIFTLADFSGDDVFTWAPSAYYMAHHAYAAGRPLAYVSPLLWVLPTNIYPGSAGTVDGGLATLLHLQPYQFVEPFTAICLGLAAAGVYLLVRVALKLPRWTALLAMTLAATSQNRFVIVGFGFAQSSRSSIDDRLPCPLCYCDPRGKRPCGCVVWGDSCRANRRLHAVVSCAGRFDDRRWWRGADCVSKPEGVTEAVEGLGGAHSRRPRYRRFQC